MFRLHVKVSASRQRWSSSIHQISGTFSSLLLGLCGREVGGAAHAPLRRPLHLEAEEVEHDDVVRHLQVAELHRVDVLVCEHAKCVHDAAGKLAQLEGGDVRLERVAVSVGREEEVGVHEDAVAVQSNP